MKYEIGDKVKIKEVNFHSSVVEALQKLNPPYILTIKKTLDYGSGKCSYEMKEINDIFHEVYIEYLHEGPKPIETRFEILDL